MTPTGPSKQKAAGEHVHKTFPGGPSGPPGFFVERSDAAMKILIQCGAVGLAGSIGALLRFAVATLSGRLFSTGFPVGTFFINITGSLFLGWFLAAVQTRIVVSDTFRLAVATGFVGAYTTFSTYMFESNKLIDEGSGLQATVNLLGSMICGLAAVRLGMWLASR
jgi:CrcB protein